MNNPKDGRGRYPRPVRTYALPSDLLIDDTETLRQCGYAATTVSPGCLKKVVVRCHNCPALFIRIRRRVTAGAVCRSCAHATDAGRARRAAGDVVTQAVRNTKVEHTCACGRRYVISKGRLRPDSSCKPCRTRKRWREAPLPEIPKLACLCDAETLSQFGYLASTVRPASVKRVVVQCTACSRKFPRMRRTVIEAALCKPCSCSRPSTNAQRAATLYAHYGENGPPVVNNYGAAADELAKFIESHIDGALDREVMLPNATRLDMLSRERQLAVEYCGLHWHNEASPSPRGPAYHRNKMLAAQSQGIRLITVFEDEWRDRRHAAEGVLLAHFGVYALKIGARKCDLRPVDLTVARDFMDAEHLQGGSRRAFAAIGLFHDGALVGAVTVAKHHRQGHGASAVVDRLCFKHGVQVVGGGSRLLRAAADAARLRDFARLVTWSDNRWSNGNVYAQSGFVLAKELPPDYSYVYVRGYRGRASKQSQKKSLTGCPSDKTEHAWALEHGLARIWDCGHKRWELDLTAT